jgi:hypothetical protein
MHRRCVDKAKGARRRDLAYSQKGSVEQIHNSPRWCDDEVSEATFRKLPFDTDV